MGRDAEESIRIGRGLLDSWEARAERKFVGTRKRTFTSHQLAIVHGLCAHAHYVGATAFDLIERGRVLAALPLVRACFEAAVKAQWVAQTRDGYAAVENESARRRSQFVASLSRATSEVFQTAATEMSVPQPPFPDTAAARSFQAICEDLVPGGTDAYVFYRAMSDLTHASEDVATRYLEPIEREPWVTLRMDPVEPEGRYWAYLTAASLVWAGRAVDYMDKHHVRREELRAAARALGCAPELQLSETAVMREVTAKRGKRTPRSA